MFSLGLNSRPGVLRARTCKTCKTRLLTPHAHPPSLASAPRSDQVLLGRNNTQNDQLSNRVAAPGDFWMHARGIPGSHAIIRWVGTENVFALMGVRANTLRVHRHTHTRTRVDTHAPGVSLGSVILCFLPEEGFPVSSGRVGAKIDDFTLSPEKCLLKSCFPNAPP
jgi:hypothetical protein